MELGFDMDMVLAWHFFSIFWGGLEFFNNIYAFGVAIDTLLLMSHNLRVVNNSCTLSLPMLSFSQLCLQ